MKVISKMMGVWRFGVGVWLGSLARELVWEFGLGVDLTPGVSKKFFYLYFYFLEKKSLRLINFGKGGRLKSYGEVWVEGGGRGRGKFYFLLWGGFTMDEMISRIVKF